ncbi:MAG: hypothetical protein HRT38_17080, partial [Alteromonadaceae bacterium]|nr:hypothetical protein [Alteromonadaceae bacterium]
MLKLILNKDDKALAEQILAGTKHINNFKKNEFSQFQNIVVNLPLEYSSTLSRKAVTPLVPAYQIDENEPYWFDEGTEFSSDIWKIKLSTWKKTINFNLVLNDGKRLTHSKHRPLLNSLKKWLVIQGNPYYNGGRILKPESIKNNLIRTMHLIDVLLLNSDNIDLAGRHMAAVDCDLILDIMVNLSAGTTNGLYNFKDYLTKFLIDSISTVSDDDAKLFIELNPYVGKPLLPDEVDLALDQKQRVKACCFLYRQGAYSKSRGKLNWLPNGRYFMSHFYKNTLMGDSLKIKAVNMLRIKDAVRNTEYPSVPVSDIESEGMSNKSIYQYLASFKALTVVSGEGFSDSVIEGIEDLNMKRISEHTIIRSLGRYTTLPASIVFTAIKDAFEFTLNYMDDILYATCNVLSNKPTLKDAEVGNYLSIYKENDFHKYIPDSLKKLGVKKWSVPDSEKGCFKLRRKNVGFCNLFDVLIGCIQIIVGATMARRQGEIIELDPIDCLLPRGIDPNENSSIDINFELIFDNRKSGSGGQNPMRETLAKPILRSVAGIVYKMQKFNERLIQEKLVRKSEATLLPALYPLKITINSCNPMTYNRHLNVFCDYFETQPVTYAENDERRYYIRQHQLRRFFAMTFFWSKGFDGLDTLRHFLAHTDTEHLYHYVTEGVPGEVLVGSKAK